MPVDHDRIVRRKLKSSFIQAIAATLLAVFTAGPAFASAGVATPVKHEERAPRSQAPVTPPAADAESQRYATREQAAQPGLEKFNGGDGFGIYIGTGALLVALLVVVAVLLI